MADLPATRVRRGLRLAIVAIALTNLFALSLPQLLVHASGYRAFEVELVAFVMVAAVLVSIGRAILRGRRPRRWLLWPVLVVAEVAALAGMPPRFLVVAAEWTFNVVCWAGLLLLLDYGFAAVACFLAGFLLARLGLLAVIGETDLQSVVNALVFTAEVFGFQTGVAVADTLVGRMAATVAAAVRDRERLRTVEVVAERLHHDRQGRYAGLDTVPLLTGLAAGVLDPADERVRTRCAVEAGRMRRLFAEQDEVPDPLMHELRACVDTAERRGLTVYLGQCGRWPQPPLSARRALTEPVLALLATARSHARITVLGSPAAVTVSVVADGDPPAEARVTGEVTVTSLAAEGRHWVEATWRT